MKFAKNLREELEMKVSARFRVAVFLAVLAAVFLAGSAWAGQSWTDVQNSFTNAGWNGITVSDGGTHADGRPIVYIEGGTYQSTENPIDLGDLSGLRVRWKANLTITDAVQHVDMITFQNGHFSLSSGLIQLPEPTSQGNRWVSAILAKGQSSVSLCGTVIKGSRPKDTGIGIEDGTFWVEYGIIDIPSGNAVFAKKVEWEIDLAHTLELNGVIFEGGPANYMVTSYGHVTTVPDSEIFFNKYDEDDDLPDSISYVVPSGAIWDIEGVTSDMTGLPTVATVKMTVKSGGKLSFKNGTHLKFKGSLVVEDGGIIDIDDTSELTIVDGTSTSEGTINIKGTLRNKGTVINGGIIDNYSSNTLDNQGSLTNNGTINNRSTGKITNTGSIDNTNGTITNEGTFQSVQTKEEMGGAVSGEVQPLNSSNSSSGGGGGCNAGFGIVGLLLAGFAALKRDKA
jgi:hypothetical protein